MDVKAQFSTPDGDYDITIKEPLLGHEKQPTWFGVGLDKKMHGNTNTGTRKLPKMPTRHHSLGLGGNFEKR
ncbi:MAG: hypothetical protein RQM92_04915 [Candidatus Syntrophopropionicum ammoniitolerans]